LANGGSVTHILACPLRGQGLNVEDQERIVTGLSPNKRAVSWHPQEEAIPTLAQDAVEVKAKARVLVKV
jgi:uncharacterized protein YbaR (Trm112 family)